MTTHPHHDAGAIMVAEVERLRRENQRLRDALRWYADVWNYADGVPPDASAVEADCGRRAREALGQEKSET